MASEDRPQYLHGRGTVGPLSFSWGSGMPGKYWSIPYGDYPITPNAPTGAWAHQVGAIPIANNVIPDPQLGRNRIGIMIHSGSAASLDALYTQGCFKVDPQDWPAVRQEILKEASNGPLYLHVQPGGVASFTNTQTLQQTHIPTATTPNAPPVTASTPGTTLTSTPAGGSGVYSSLANIESNNRNIPSGVDKDYPGMPGSKSQGYFQIDTPTWQQFGAKAGIDLNQYPNAMSAPREVQQQVAGLIPLSRFGGRTLRMLGQQYGPFDKSMTVGQLDQRLAKPGAMNMAQQQQTQSEGIVDPSIVARGGTSPPIPGTPEAATATPTTTAATPTQPQTVADKIRSLITPQQGQQGQQAQSPLGQLASSVGSAFKAPEPPKIEQQPPPSSAGEFGAQQARMQASAPLFQQIVAQAGKPLTFTSAPPGAQAGLQQTPGMTLNTNPYAVGYGYGSVYGA